MSLHQWQKIQAAAESIRRVCASMSPNIGLVLGSGLGAAVSRMQDERTIPYADIPHWPQPTIKGHTGRLRIGRRGKSVVAVLEGRVHYYEGYDPEVVVFSIRVLAALGIKRLILTNAAGSLNPEFRSGEIMLIRDHINHTGTSPLRGPNDERIGPRFPNMSELYAISLRERMQLAATNVGLILREGVYIGVTGPAFETPSEVRLFRSFGADAVGMSTVLEAIAGYHAGMEIAALSCLTNMGAGMKAHDSQEEAGRGPSHHETLRVASSCVKGIAEILQDLFS